MARPAAQGRPGAIFALPPMIPDVPGMEQTANAQAAQDTVDPIRPRAETLSAGNADAVAETKNVVSATRETLFENEPQGFGAATQNMRHWQGSNAEGFRTYLNQTDTAYRDAQDVLGDLATLYDLYGNIVTECHTDLIAILQAGLSAFQNVDQQAIPIVLATASAALAPLTAGDSLVLVALAGIVGGASALVAPASVPTSSDLDIAQSIVTVLDTLRDNTTAACSSSTTPWSRWATRSTRSPRPTCRTTCRRSRSRASRSTRVPSSRTPRRPTYGRSRKPIGAGIQWPTGIERRLNPM